MLSLLSFSSMLATVKYVSIHVISTQMCLQKNIMSASVSRMIAHDCGFLFEKGHKFGQGLTKLLH